MKRLVIEMFVDEEWGVGVIRTGIGRWEQELPGNRGFRFYRVGEERLKMVKRLLGDLGGVVDGGIMEWRRL